MYNYYPTICNIVDFVLDLAKSGVRSIATTPPNLTRQVLFWFKQDLVYYV